MKAVQFAEHGGNNEVLRVVDVSKPGPGPNELLVENVVAGERARAADRRGPVALGSVARAVFVRARTARQHQLPDTACHRPPAPTRHPAPAPGVNFIDTYFRSGLYPAPLPSTSGVEGAGVVAAVGSAVAGFQPGDRVVYSTRPPDGSYAQFTAVAASGAVLIPDGISFEDATAVQTVGNTALALTTLVSCSAAPLAATAVTSCARGALLIMLEAVRHS